MATDFSQTLAFDESGATVEVEVINAIDSQSTLDGDAISMTETGVFVRYDDASNLYFVPWTNVKAIRQALAA